MEAAKSSSVRPSASAIEVCECSIAEIAFPILIRIACSGPSARISASSSEAPFLRASIAAGNSTTRAKTLKFLESPILVLYPSILWKAHRKKSRVSAFLTVERSTSPVPSRPINSAILDQPIAVVRSENGTSSASSLSSRRIPSSFA